MAPMRPPQLAGKPVPVRLVSIIFLMVTALLPSSSQGVTQQLVCSPSSLKFGTVLLGQSETLLVTLTNTGLTSATVSGIAVNGSAFSVSGLTLPATIAAGQSIDLNVIFSPTIAGWIGGEVAFTSNASNTSLILQVTGGGTATQGLSATPSSLSFGNVAVGSSATLSVVLTSVRQWKETLTALQTVGSSFSVSGPTLPVVLTTGQTATLNVTFTPQAIGLASGSVFVAGPNVNIPFSGIGTVGLLTVLPTSLNFGNIDIGSTGLQSFSVTAIGGSVTIFSASSSNSQFALSGGSFPVTINEGQSLGFNVIFSPTTSGNEASTLTLVSNASNQQATESLSGVGLLQQYDVNLSWSPSMSSVVGYNVYRGILPGVYSKINTSLDPNTAYSDNTVVSGLTYYYAATAVSSSGEESSYSTPIQVSIP
jgi:hypothetical protein